MVKLDPVESEDGYYVGIQVVNNFTGALTEVIPPIVISEGDEHTQKMYLVATIPITCNHDSDCFLGVKVKSENSALSTCTYR